MALHEGLYISRWDQPHLMTELADSSGPVMFPKSGGLLSSKTPEIRSIVLALRAVEV
jgi:hypothetical protein